VVVVRDKATIHSLVYTPGGCGKRQSDDALLFHATQAYIQVSATGGT
jgi:hypothetical protein